MNWLVFDFGEVIAPRTDALPRLADRFGVPLADFERAYWGRRDPWDAGCSDLEYWGSIGADLGRPVDERFSAELTELDLTGWGRTDPETIALLEELADSGAALALLSNAPSSMGRFVEGREWSKLFRHLVFSGDLGMMKPDAGIYRELVRRLGAEPGECLFFDDRQANIDGARAAGLRAELWRGAAEARKSFG